MLCVYCSFFLNDNFFFKNYYMLINNIFVKKKNRVEMIFFGIDFYLYFYNYWL